jgi:hypothetical protein
MTHNGVTAIESVKVFSYHTGNVRRIFIFAEEGWTHDEWLAAVKEAGVTDEYASWDYHLLDDGVEMTTVAMEVTDEQP